MTIDNDLSIYMISRIQADSQPWTILDLKNPDHQAAGAFVEKKLYPQGIYKIVDRCVKKIIGFFCKKQARFNAAKRLLDKGITRIPPILNFMIEFNRIIKNENFSFPEMNFKNFNNYAYDHQFIFYWWTTQLHISQLHSKKAISCLKGLQMSSKRYQKLSLFRTLKTAQRDLSQWKEATQLISHTLSDLESRYLVMKLFEKIGKRTSDPIFVKKQFTAHWARNAQQSFIAETASLFVEQAKTHTFSSETFCEFYKKIDERQKMIVEILQKGEDQNVSPPDLIPAFHSIPQFKQSFKEILTSFQKTSRDPASRKKRERRGQRANLFT